MPTPAHRWRALPLACLALYLLFSTKPVLAHEGTISNVGSLLSGLTHPVLGPDHLLAMLSVGLLSAQIGGRAIWTVPATFVGVMALGGISGLLVAGFSLTELGIGLSVVALGVAIAAERSIPMRIALAAVGLFALFHGYAHGLEMPQTAQPVLYALGFLMGTALIHVAGVVIGDISQHYAAGRQLLRLGGGIIAVIGVLFVTGLL